MPEIINHEQINTIPHACDNETVDKSRKDTEACSGFYHCANDTRCIPMRYVSNSKYDCPLHDDESYYTNICKTTECSCSQGSIQCTSSDFLDSNVFHKQARKINITGINMTDKVKVTGLHYLAELILANCNLKSVPSLNNLWNLLLLDLSYNEISTLTEGVFQDLGRLRHLNLTGNTGLLSLQPGWCDALDALTDLILDHTGIVDIGNNTFHGLSNLERLSVAHTELSVIHDGGFSDLGITSLTLTGKSHVRFQEGVFRGLRKLQRLKTDTFYLCCDEVRPVSLKKEMCFAPNYGLSSCSDLMQEDSLKVFIWILAVGALLGNCLSLGYRLMYDKSSLKNRYGVFVSNLCISDLIMGIYMIIIAVADINYRGVYLWNDFDWRNSWMCQLAGFLSTLSCESSTMFICLITLDRFLVIKYPFVSRKFKRKPALVASLIVWVVNITVASIPLLPTFTHWELYTRSSVCLALPLMDDDYEGRDFSFVVFIGVNFIAFMFIIVGQAAIYKAVRSGATRTSNAREAQDRALAKK